MKLTFTCQHDDNSRNTLETHSITLPEILLDFEMFLRGSGFRFDGDVAIVDSDTPPWDPLQEILLQEENDPWTKVVERHEEELEQTYLNNVIAKKNFAVHSILSFMIYLISNKFYLSNSREIDHFRIKNEPKYYDAE
jgi:hypothetical protein